MASTKRKGKTRTPSVKRSRSHCEPNDKKKMEELIKKLFSGDDLPGYLKVGVINKEVTLHVDLGIETPEGVRRLEEIYAMNYENLHISRLEIDGPTHLQWEFYTNVIIRLLVVRNIPTIGVPEIQIEGIKSRMTAMVLFILRQDHKAESLKIGGKNMALRSLIDTNVITSRISTIAYSPLDEEIEQVKTTLTSYLTDGHIPKPLRSMLCKAHKLVKKNNHEERRVRQRKHRAAQGSTSPSSSSASEDSASESSCYLSDDSTVVDVQEDQPAEIPDSFLEALPDPGAGGEKGEPATGGAQAGPSRYQKGKSADFFSDKCYVCTRSWTPPKHPTDAIQHYPNMCPSCAELNWSKRNHSVDLTGYIAVVTGGRIKIGFDTVLKLLRCGCRVVTTTRFPHDAAQRYAAQSDYNDWCDRLQIYPLELKDAKAIYKFIDYLKQNVPHIDILISNAAQTIRRPITFFEHLLEQESKPFNGLPAPQQQLLAVPQSLTYQNMGDESMVATTAPTPAAITRAEADSSEANEKKRPHPETPEEASSSKRPKMDLPGPENTAEGWSEAVIKKTSDGHFPKGCLDEFGQQVDLRPTNSWRTVLEEVSIPELLEVMMVNTIAPYILSKELKELMVASPNERRFIVNITAMEGQFNRAAKTRYHPHTNMAKAALNMMTRTGALGYRESGIYMTSVDTGWVSDQRPFEQASYEKKKRQFTLPLDCVDAAARILDPIFSGIEKTREPFYAVYLKNYRPFKW